MIKLKYGQKVYDEIAMPINQVDKQIADLKTEQDKLKKQLSENAGNFDVKVIRASGDVEQELSLIETAIERAEAYRIELIDGQAYENFKKADQVYFDIINAEKDVKASHAEQIKKKIVEIYDLYDEAKAYDEQVTKDLLEYVDTVKEYLSDTVVIQGGLDTPAERIRSRYPAESRNGMRVLNYFNEEQHKLNGILPPPEQRITLDK